GGGVDGAPVYGLLTRRRSRRGHWRATIRGVPLGRGRRRSPVGSGSERAWARTCRRRAAPRRLGIAAAARAYSLANSFSTLRQLREGDGYCAFEEKASCKGCMLAWVEI